MKSPILVSFFRSILLLTIFIVCSGFFWGAKEDGCGEAQKLLKDYESQEPAARTALESRVMQLCPEGAVGRYILGRTYERGENEERAFAEYQAVLQLDPRFAPASGRLGLIYLRRGELDNAAVELTKALQGDQNPQYHKGLAGVFGERKLHSLALYHCSEALKAFPGDRSLLTGKAEALSGLARYDEAIQVYRQLVAQSPGDTGAVMGLARTFEQAKRNDQAIELLKGAAAASPGNKELHRRLYDLYEQKGDTAGADYEAVLAGLPPRVKVNQPNEEVLQADALLASKDYEKAASLYKKLLKESPDLPGVRQKLAMSLEGEGKDDEAIALFKEVPVSKIKSADVHSSLARLYDKKGLPDEAIVSYRRALEFADADPRIRVSLADIYAKRGSYPQAIEQYKAFLKAAPADLPVQLKLAKTLVNVKNIPEAIAVYTEALRTAPDSLEAHQDLAVLYKKSNKIDEAEKEYREVLRLKKDDAEARTALTSLYVKQKKYDELIQLLKESIELNPKDPTAHYKLGLVYEFSRDYENAITAYKETVGLKDDHAKALNALGRVTMKVGKLAEAKGYLERARLADPEMEETTVLLSNIRDEFSSDNSKKKKKSKKGKKSKKVKKTKKVKKKSTAAKKGNTAPAPKKNSGG